MKIRSRALGALAGLFVFATMAVPAHAADRPYTEGSVLNVAAIRTEPGMFEEYMKYLAGPYKQLMEEQKKAGIILGYNIYVANPRSPDEPDLYLVTIYKDMAALDGMNAKTDPITEKLYGGMDQQTTSTVQRGKLRTLIGDELIRELVLK
jgi:L-rhamnose mutarotase